MKVPVKWLKEYIDITVSLKELAERLTMAGTEVSVLSLGGESWDGVVIGCVEEIEPHPNADRLRLVTVDTADEKHKVVCGAPNLTIGDKIAFATLGAELTDGHSGKKAVLKEAKIRGVVSCGMVCSEMELGISQSHEGILVLPPEAPLGRPLADFLGDTVFDLEITPNRPDMLSMLGVAIEAAALTGQKVKMPKVCYEETGTAIAEQVLVEIADKDLCPRYCASLVHNIKVGESPDWLKQRLIACGMRPISNIVDITNYVMLEYGQPMHGFDLERLKDKKIIVRRARAGEVITTLDDIERKLDDKTLVIADSQKAVAIAGVMGGANSEMNENTTSILLESANFNPASIHFTSHGLKLVSEASMRFERAIRPDLTVPALKRATQLMVELAGGEAAEGIIDVYPGKKDIKPVQLRLGEAKRLLGVEFSPQQIEETLQSLGFGVKKVKDGEYGVTPSDWRSDINIEADVVEEIARIIGYDKIPMSLIGGALQQQNPEPMLAFKSGVRNIIAGYGFQEIIGFSLASTEAMEKVLNVAPLKPAPVHLLNAMTAEHEYLRTTLRSNLLTALAENLKHEDAAIKLFEQGRVYLPRLNDLPEEPEMLCGIMSSEAEKSWPNAPQVFDFFSAKGIVEGLLSQLDIEADYAESNDAGLCPGKQAAVIIDGRGIGVVGEISPQVAAAFELKKGVYLFELDLTQLLSHTLGHGVYRKINRFPSVMRDIALVVDDKTSHRQLLDAMKGFPLVEKVTLFDVYSGKQVPEGKKSLAYRISYQSAKDTLTDKEVDKIQQKILNKLSGKFGATLRA